jgi:peptidyl-prolyl cis-trans isomerase SDCCAG10
VEDLETDDDDRPLFPPKILSVDVVWNPFDDIVPRRLPSKEEKTSGEKKKKKKKCARKYVPTLWVRACSSRVGTHQC